MYMTKYYISYVLWMKNRDKDNKIISGKADP